MILDLKKYVFYNKGDIFQYVASIAGAFSIMSSGVNLGWTSPYLPILTRDDSPIPTTSEQGSWCAIAPLLGSPFGALSAMYLSDILGRKITTLLMAPIVAICFVLIAFSKNIWELTAYRFIIGATEGASYTALPMYIGEISDPKIRGFLTATIAIFAISGTLLINVIGSFMGIFTSSIICAGIPLIHFIIFAFMPESPYYYIKKNNHLAAKQSLEIFRGKADVVKEMENLRRAVTRQERSTKTGIIDIFNVASTRKACYIFLILNLTNKFSGKNPCLFYTETIFTESGSSINPTLSVIIYCSVELIAVVISTYFIVDTIGKRKLMITSTAGCALSVFCLGMFFYLKDFHIGVVENVDWLPITALVLYNIFFSVGLSFGPVSILSELFPTNVKAKALGIADTFSVLMGSLVSKLFQITMDEFGSMSVPFLFFAVCCTIGLFFIIKYFPETKGKTLEEIQQYLIGENNTSLEMANCNRM
ncbi:facilitated trehalose transporter Tret1-like [Diorhabda sublineata]|uniref:facilitated trehalose transporter Tret1-like n=1 Tax=Diorhabda sublineata TaxID=1163346 RepID=UPI0024E08CD3|nr:facilitated trehalose transporter Tret1-like [Diorhabda sublineata]